MRRLIYPLLRMAKNTSQQSFQDSTLTLGKGEVTSSILVTGFECKKRIATVQLSGTLGLYSVGTLFR